MFGVGTLLWGIALAAALNFGFVYYYQSSGQSEAHQLARWLRRQGGTVAAYQLPRRNKDLGTGRPKIQETSLPSLGFYLDSTFVPAERLDPLTGHVPVWVFTRQGRITGTDQARMTEMGYRLDPVATPTPTRFFSLFKLEKR